MSTLRRLPGPIADIWDWQRRGSCRGRDAAQFFHPDGERGLSRVRREQQAKAVCRGCPVRAECAAHALTVREAYGVWGGFTEAERLQLLARGAVELIRGGRAEIDLMERLLRGRATATTRLSSAAPRPRVPVHRVA